MGEDWQRLLEQASRLRQERRVTEAIAAYERLLAVKADLPDSWYNLGWLYRQARRFEDALTAYARALRLHVREPQEVHLNRAVILSDHLGRSEAASAELQEALRFNPTYVPALINLGNLHEDRGEQSEARQAYQRALDADRSNCLALARLAGISSDSDTAEMILRLQQRLAQPGLEPADQADLGFALGRLLDRSGQHDAAFEAFSNANSANRTIAGTGGRYDRAAHEAFVEAIIKAFPEPASRSNVDATTPPLFILGMFRSGSTLVEQILGAHSRIHAGGELDLMPTLLRALTPYPEAAAQLDAQSLAHAREAYLEGLPEHPPGRLITDKRPDNFLHVGLIKRMFPDAKIIHTVRNPLDNLLSLYFLQLDPRQAYAHDLDDAFHWYRQYRRLMVHWRSLYPNDILDVSYDALVADPRPEVERMLEFIGLGWEEACLEFHSQPSVVKTASVWQVREPLYRRSSGRWMHYERHLIEVRKAFQQE